MTAGLTIEDAARHLADGLVSREQARTGANAEAARARVAGRLRALPGTLENLHKGRLKEVGARLLTRLAAAAEVDLRNQIEALNHELALARRCRCDIDLDQVREVEAHLGKARSALAALLAVPGRAPAGRGLSAAASPSTSLPRPPKENDHGPQQR